MGQCRVGRQWSRTDVACQPSAGAFCLGKWRTNPFQRIRAADVPASPLADALERRQCGSGTALTRMEPRLSAMCPTGTFGPEIS
ncbi:MAG: hypothetical protein OJF60_002281 [Burkholderiaceae bacterium]|nr:MAG: hypothetical protein OJF60_002281 [Burkholderiaceae bacterium]